MCTDIYARICNNVLHRGIPPQLALFQVFNATAELNDVINYPYLRLFTVADKTSATPKYDIIEVEEKWSVPSKGNASEAVLDNQSTSI